MDQIKTTIVGICAAAVLLFSLTGLSGCGESTPPSGAAAAPEVSTPVTSPDAYAPMLAVPKSLPDAPGVPMLVTMMDRSVMPSTSEVNIPVYPGAQMMAAMGPMDMTWNGEKMSSFPSMTLLSADEMGDVLAFYQEQLAAWKYQEFYGSHSFWNGGEDSNPLDITGQFSLLSILPLSETDSVRTVWPEMRTRIDLRYEPSAP